MHTKNFTHIIVAGAIALAVAGLTSVRNSPTADIISNFIGASMNGELAAEPRLSAFGDVVVGAAGGSAMGGRSTVQLRVPKAPSGVEGPTIRQGIFHGAASSSSKKLTPCAR